VIRARTARCFLYERLSNVPVRLAPITGDNNAFRTKVADFPAHLTPELAQELDKHHREFLASHGIAPVSGRENLVGRDISTLTATGSWARSSTRPRPAYPRSRTDSLERGQGGTNLSEVSQAPTRERRRL
jgi:hypothetical protein